MRWTEELRAALDHEFNGQSRVMMLATVDAAGAPHVRCLVCRRIDEEGRIYAAIDARTQKDPQIRKDHRAEVLFWMPNIRIQFRIAGEAKIITFPEDELLHKEIWRRLSDKSRSLFFWPTPGVAADPDNAFPQAVSADVTPPRNFEVFILTPKQVDRLSLDSHPQRRRVWRCDTNWSGVDVNP